jgi:hypothetical protein
VDSLRHLARALLLGTTVALLFDVALQNALAAAQTPGTGSLTPWWVVGRVFERGVWVVFALLCWAAVPTVLPAARRLWPATHTVSPGSACDVIGRVMFVAPLIWLAASVLILALRITLQGDWALDGSIFRTAAFYNNVLLDYLPWAVGGYVLIVVGRHAAD